MFILFLNIITTYIEFLRICINPLNPTSIHFISSSKLRGFCVLVSLAYEQCINICKVRGLNLSHHKKKLRGFCNMKKNKKKNHQALPSRHNMILV